MKATTNQKQDLWIARNLLHDATYQPVNSRVKSDGFIDRQPKQKPVLCKDGKYRHPFYVPKELALVTSNDSGQTIKAYGAFV